MAIASRTITAFTKTIAALAAKPAMTAAAVQAWFDQSPEECRLAINGIVADLIAQTAAAQLGFAPTSDIASSTIQTAIEEVLVTAKDAQLGTLLDGTVTGAKLVEALARAAVASRVHDVGGTATAITSTDADITALYDNMPFNFIVGASNSSAATTLAIGALGAKPVYKVGTTDAPNLTAGKQASLWYDLGAGCFFLKASADGTAIPAQVLAPNPFSNESDSGIIGTMVDRSGDSAATDLVLSSTTLKLRPPEGYYDGVNDYVTNADGDRLAANVKLNINFDGLTGTYDAKRYASGSVSSDGNGDITVTGLPFTPGLVILKWTYGTYGYRVLFHPTTAFNAKVYYNAGGWQATSVEGVTVSGSSGSNTNFNVSVSGNVPGDNFITMNSDGFTTRLEGAPSQSMTYYAWEA